MKDGHLVASGHNWYDALSVFIQKVADFILPNLGWKARVPDHALMARRMMRRIALMQ
jgi:hypothetical protein